MVVASAARRALSLGRAATEGAISSRAVHIKIEPRTRDLYESRAILRVLKKFGDVVWYQNLKFDRSNPAPNTLICIYENEGSAADLIRSSPMRFNIPPPPRLTASVLSLASMDLQQAFPTHPEHDRATSAANDTDSAAANGEPQNASGVAREFVLSADVSLADHQGTLMQKEFSWGFRDHRRSFAQAALAKEVPERGMASLSLHQRTVPSRIVNRMTKEVENYVEDVRQRLRP